ncbi:MAG: formate/nitrite transporter family protein [Clostridiales Family XIII bacterium]|jgi:formate/nitrite transporter|nr:formate/nitrite transporter family protein [Clostridiales Family XIII bacterium]
MSPAGCLAPAEIIGVTIQTGIKKSKTAVVNMLLLGFLAGAFIAFASEASNMAAFNLLADPGTYGLGKVLAGAIFGAGLMLVLLAGGELFTGNVLMIAGLLDRKLGAGAMLRNWVLVYIGNFFGSLFIAYMMHRSGLFASGDNVLGAMTVKIAVYKVGLTYPQAFILGIMCNWLVCLAVWLSYGAKDMTGKMLAVFFPIWLFITSGFEHCVANMYYIPAGIMAKGSPAIAEAAAALGLSSDKLDGLGWGSFALGNLIPVTLGNIVGGGLFVAAAYWFAYARKKPAGDDVK